MKLFSSRNHIFKSYFFQYLDTCWNIVHFSGRQIAHFCWTNSTISSSVFQYIAVFIFFWHSCLMLIDCSVTYFKFIHKCQVLKCLQFEKDRNTVIQTLHKWFHNNLLFLNFEKTQLLQFLTKNTNATKLHLTFNNIHISNTEHSKFLGLMINSGLSWKSHIDLMIPKFNTATYVIRSLKQLLNLETLKKAHFSFAHSILSYGIIFWGISNYSKNIFKIQKRIIRIIMNVDNRTSCRSLFKQLGILCLQSQYIFSLMMFVAKNRELFAINANVHNFPTRSHNDLHLPNANLSVFQKGVYFSGVKIFNNLPADLK